MTEIIATTKSDLEKSGYTGLFYPGECACTIDDFAPCGEDTSECEFGYKFVDPNSERSNSDFIVKKDNSEPTEAEWVEWRNLG